MPMKYSDKTLISPDVQHNETYDSYNGKYFFLFICTCTEALATC